MDELIYTAMTSGKHTMAQLATITHNLANIGTDGFKAQMDTFRAVSKVGTDLPVQTFVVNSTVGADFSPGVTRKTGRDLDVAVQGSGWLVVTGADGKEAYTRSGSLKTNENGLLQTQNGFNVVGTAGYITIPPDETVTISRDGTISSIPMTNQIANSNLIGQLKLVNPPANTLVRGADGLFRTNDGSQPDADPNVTVVGGSIENSNVNAVESLVSMISLSRAFDMHMQMLADAKTNDAKASTILDIA